MCGIAGIVRTGKKGGISFRLIERMMRLMRHRGPDDEGTYIDERVALGHTRLSIIDISNKARQPIGNEDGSLRLVFNGEIYNYKSVRTQLEERGHHFHSEMDGEVILHLYEDHLFDCVTFLDGMFAFALYDSTRGTMFLARDRIGEKPLYYTWEQDAFVFASELKCLWGLSSQRPALSDAAVMNYFLYTQIPAPYSALEGIFKLLPSHYMVIRAGVSPRIQPYWHLDYTRKLTCGLGRAVEGLKEVLQISVKQSLTSDVPIGVTLSGGVDSSTILAMIRHYRSGRIKTFTLGRAGAGEDPEFERARKAAIRFGTDHATFPFEAVSFKEFEAAVSYFDEPVGLYDTVYNLYFIRYLKQYVKVIITGNGADEVFGGYASYSDFVKRTAIRQLCIDLLSPNRRRASIDCFLRRRLNRHNRDNARLVYSDRLADHAKHYDVAEYLGFYWNLATYDHILDARLFLDLMVTLNHSASLPDTTGMVNSVESRSPFLGRDVVEFSSRLPTCYKVPIFGTQRSTKYVLKRLALEYLPRDMVFVDKYGCGHFIDYIGLMRFSWRGDIESLFFEHGVSLGAYFSLQKIHNLWRRFLNDRLSIDEKRILIKLTIFLIWHKRVIVNILPLTGLSQET